MPLVTLVELVDAEKRKLLQMKKALPPAHWTQVTRSEFLVSSGTMSLGLNSLVPHYIMTTTRQRTKVCKTQI